MWFRSQRNVAVISNNKSHFTCTLAVGLIVGSMLSEGGTKQLVLISLSLDYYLERRHNERKQ